MSVPAFGLIRHESFANVLRLLNDGLQGAAVPAKIVASKLRAFGRVK